MSQVEVCITSMVQLLHSDPNYRIRATRTYKQSLLVYQKIQSETLFS